MQTLNRLADIQPALLALSPAADTTVSLVVIDESMPTPSDIIAMRHGRKVCDVLVVAVLADTLPETIPPILEEAGVHILFHHGSRKPEKQCEVQLENGDNLTHLLQIILAVMPSLVVSGQQNLAQLQRLQAIHNTFSALFTLEIAETPSQILSERQQALLEAMSSGQLAINHGERQVRAILQHVLAALAQQGFHQVEQLTLVDGQTFNEPAHLSGGTYYLHAEVAEGARILRQSLKLQS